MTNHHSKIDTELQALLAEVPDEKERARLIKAWQALDPLAGKSCAPPAPSRELERIFAGSSGEMSDDELHLLAAAGIAGTNGNDSLNGTSGVDVMVGLEGDDTLDGGDGNDVVSGGEGDDALYGGRGDDILYGGEGDDALYGGRGDDTLYGGEGSDTFHFTLDDGDNVIADFDPENDVIHLELDDPDARLGLRYEDGNTILTYQGGSITIQGQYLNSGEFRIDIHGTDGDDFIPGSPGTNVSYGEGGNDVMYGEAGDDTLDGGADNDKLYGGYGNDVLYGGEGNDVLTGGAGSDTYIFSSDSGTDRVTDFNPGGDHLDFLGADDISNISVSHDENGNTVVTFGETTVILEGVTLTLEEVWASRAK